MTDSSGNTTVGALISSGLFERHWYMAQTGIYFHSALAAAEHFLGQGMQKEFSPHPLIEPHVWPEHLRTAWKKGEFTAVVNWFRRPKLRQPALGPLFEARYLDIPDGAFASHPGGVLGYFLENAGEETVLPTRYGQVPFGPLKASWPALYSRLKTQNRLTAPRTTSMWNYERDAEWRRALPGVQELPEGFRFSIIMPAWNRSEAIAAAIRSVQAQTFSDWELLVVDDGSTDTTRDVVQAMATVDPRVSLIEADHGGVSSARNRGMAAATGDYIAFLDSDNEWPSDYLELMARGTHRSGARAAYAGLELHDNGKVSYRAFVGGLDHLLLLNHIDLNVFVVEAALAKKTGFDTGLRRWVDHDFAIRVAKVEEPSPFPFIGCIYNDDRQATNRITTSESDAWQWKVLGNNLIDWDEAAQSAVVPERVSIVMPVYQDWSMTLRAVNAVLENSGSVDVEVIVVDNGSAYYHGAAISQFFAAEPRVRYVRLARNLNFAIGSNYGASLATGEFICFLNNDTEVRPGWLEPLVLRLADPEVRAVQPLLQYPDDSIQAAGTIFVAPRSVPTHFMHGFPPEDAQGLGTEKFSALTAACMLMRRKEVFALRGFDAIFVNGMEDADLCLRARKANGGYFVVEPASKVTHHESKTPGRGKNIPENRKTFLERWGQELPPFDHAKYENAGFLIADIGADKVGLPQPRPTIVRDRMAPRNRWGIRYSAIGGQRGDRWGDTFYVNSLAHALEGQGKQVVTYRHGANSETGRSFTDVNLVLRGIDKLTPLPDQVNILWVISHPDDVTVEEIRSFDRVYASSILWAQKMTEASGVRVHPLLQATDTRIFHPPSAEDLIEKRPMTFVGGHFPQRQRKVVADALASGVDMRVIGHGWKNLPPNVHEAEGIPNHELGGVYRGAQRVLADHWEDMAAMGFIQNRIFDAVACGTPVITDDVPTLTDVFGSLVQVYEGIDHLRHLAGPHGEGVFGSPQERLEQAENVLANHSFAARAEQLVADAQVLRTSMGW